MGRAALGRHIVLVGMAGVGKSTVAASLASRLGIEVVDVDSTIVAEARCSVAEIFEREGEASFRARESASLTKVLSRPAPLVIATGGGVVVDPSNRELLARAWCVWLRASVEDLIGRVGPADRTRPLLGDDPSAALERLLVERESWYRAVSSLEVDTTGRTIAEIVSEIVGEATTAGLLSQGA